MGILDAIMGTQAATGIPRVYLHRRKPIRSLDEFDHESDVLGSSETNGRVFLHQMMGLFDAATPWPGGVEDARRRVEDALMHSAEPAELWPTYRRLLVTRDLI